MVNKYLLFFSIVVLIYSCQKQEFQMKSNEINGNSGLSVDTSKIVKGTIRIKVTDDFAKKIELSIDDSSYLTKSSSSSLNELMQLYGATRVKRTFPPAGKFESRTRKKGLHLWYDLYFDKSMPATKACKELQQIDGIQEVEYKVKIKKTQVVIPFNDPDFLLQWHYYNNASRDGFIEGADINVLPVWKSYTKGSSNVIVSIVDGGVDTNHEDLVNNMWVNEAEYKGTRGRDDDGNGYIDDIYGFNFIRNVGTITADDHGTHVAGTISAVNNNGKGVSGIAGGDYENNIQGARLMSCQIFSDMPEDDGLGGNSAAAIKYGADNGAVISQNSWAYEDPIPLPGSIKAAIDYFVEFAGVDEMGNQVGPIKGGIVIFAAGNDNRELSTPSSYEKVLSVAAIAPNFTKASYSNYADWIDISAPGGESGYGRIYSTYPSNQYGFMRGTSMACPHVSGVAALVVSYYGGPGFTNEMLWNRLVTTATDIYQYNRGYAGKLGSGLVNAFAAIASLSTKAPEAVSSVQVDATSNNINVKWKVTADVDDVKAYGFTVYYSTEPIGSQAKTKTSSTIMSRSVLTGDLNVSDYIELTLSDLNFAKLYYISVDAYDFSSNRSLKSPAVSVTTEPNLLPVITPLDGLKRDIRAFQTAYFNFKFSDPDNHNMTWKIVPGSTAETAALVNDNIQVAISGKNATAGSYIGKLEVEDQYGAKANVNYEYVIRENIPPKVVGQVENVYIEGIGKSMVIDLSDIITDEDGEPLSYSTSTSPSSVIHANISDNKLYITSLRYGLTEVTVSATDALNKSVSIIFKTLVRDGSKEIDIYPNPVKENLYIRTGAQKSAEISIFSTSGAKIFGGNFSISPFEPAKVDMTRASGGAYTVVVKIDGKEIINNIVKL